MAKARTQGGYQRIVAKFGTNLLTAGTDKLDRATMSSLVAQVVRLMDEGREVVVVTSGAIAAQLGLTEGAVRTATTRLRERFRTRLRSCVSETLSPDATDHEIDAELRELTATLRATR